MMNVMMLRIAAFGWLMSISCLAESPAPLAARTTLTSPPVESLTQTINHHLQRGWDANDVVAAEPLDDDGFLRRVCLDLAGRIPTLQERSDFRSLTGPDKRQRLVDQLLDSPDFAFQQRNELDRLLLARKKVDSDWRAYLLEACRANRTWDRIFQEIMLPEYEYPETMGPAAFIRERAHEIDDLTNDVSSLLFGVNIACAKCHDHPLVDDWQQQHYFGMAMFFQRTYRTRAGFVGERPTGRLKFVDVFEEDNQAEFMFLSGATIDEPAQELSEEQQKRIDELVRKAERDANAERPPLPNFSPRQQLVSLAIKPTEANFFSRNMVNRTWARLMGRGLVHPLDQMHRENPASHPELLEFMATNFATHGYDLKHLIRGIVLSDAYGRSSHWSGDGELPPAELYAVAVPRPLSPWQLALSLEIATCHPDQLPGLVKPADWKQQRERFESQAHTLAQRFEIPEDGFQVGAEEALFFNNAPEVENLFLPGAGNRLVAKLKSITAVDDQVHMALTAVLTREPSPDETQVLSQYLDQRHDRPGEAIRQVVWALLTSPEFRFNH